MIPLAVVGAGVASALLQVADRPPCMVVETPPYRCLDDRLTGTAGATVLRIEDDAANGGIPTWVVGFVVDGRTVQARIPDWPAPRAPRVGGTTTVAYDPQAPTTRVTPAEALAEARARAARSGGFSLTRWFAWTVGLAAFWSLPTVWRVRRQRRARSR